MSKKKLTILAFTESDFSGKVGQYVAQVNPSSYEQGFTIDYEAEGPIGGANTPLKFARMPPQTIKFELLFDGTGVIPGSGVSSEIKAFLKVVYDYQGTIHEPHYLKLIWGGLTFGARLASLNIQYTLFNTGGTPLRAKADATFRSYVDAQTLAKEERRESPDVTHEVMVRAGDTLPLLCDRIYGDPGFYMQVAEANRLSTVLYLKPGTRLLFPPIAR